jgi:7,8-dihydropterin-6-yl-methyl-4-(beta-D-ribofuranosyl)aminobenzene 5'-phosphate synthase
LPTYRKRATRMNISILYDNMAREGYRADWGFSCLIGESLLFDTGRDLNILLYNMNSLGIDLSKIERVVISHQHRDHVGGIGILEKLGEVEVFLPSSISNPLKKSIERFEGTRVVEVSESQDITDEVTSLGELGKRIKEQSILVHTDNGNSLICGCAHPGLEEIMDSALEHGPLYGVIGGFHDFDRLLALEYSHLIVPCHCTSKKKDIRTLYKLTSKECAVGQVFEI